MKDLYITIHNGGDEAVAAVERIGDDWRAQLDQAATEVARLRLTDAEREAVESVLRILYSTDYEVEYTTLRGLLERHKQPRTKEAAHMSDENERSVASTGSVAGEPVAWMVTDPSGRIEACRESFSEAAQLATDFTATEDGDVVYKAFPVYSQPQNGVVVQLPRLLWDSSEKMGKGEWDYQQRVKTALEVAGVKWAVVE